MCAPITRSGIHANGFLTAAFQPDLNCSCRSHPDRDENAQLARFFQFVSSLHWRERRPEHCLSGHAVFGDPGNSDSRSLSACAACGNAVHSYPSIRYRRRGYVLRTPRKMLMAYAAIWGPLHRLHIGLSAFLQAADGDCQDSLELFRISNARTGGLNVQGASSGKERHMSSAKRPYVSRNLTSAC